MNMILTTLKRDIIRAFATLDAWFDKEKLFNDYKPPAKAKDGPFALIMERVLITNSHLLSMINDGCKEALQQAKLEGSFDVNDYKLNEVIIDDPMVDQFLNRLQHKDLDGLVKYSTDEIRDELRDQLYRCLCQLELLRNGEGALHHTTLIDSAVHTMDIYHLMHLLSQNIWKNIMQLKKFEKNYTSL